MRIGFDGRYSGDHFPGIGRYSAGLARAIAELRHDHTLVLILDPRDAGRYDMAAVGRMPGVEVATLRAGPFSLRQHAAMPVLARRLRLDLLHSPYFIRPTFGLPCPSVVTIYDLIGRRFPETLSRRGRLLYRAAMGLAVGRADGIITISESARADLARAYRPSAPIAVTPLAADRRFRPRPPAEIAVLRARYHLPARYALYLGSNKPHKNLERLVMAWELVRGEQRAGGQGSGRALRASFANGAGETAVALVLAGHEARRDDPLRRFVAERGLGGSVRFLPNVADSDLPALYSGALLFAFPSFYEGFGLPPLEAMACGVPVLCANASSLPEVVGDAALSVDPYSVEAIAQGLGRLLREPALRRELGARGQRRARDFSWRRTALGTLRLYEQAVEGR